MFINNFDPVAVQIFSIDIKWYSLAYIIGILLGWILSKKIFISDQNIKEKFDDFITYLILGIIVGGRLGYVFFYNFSYYSDNLLDIIKIWQGGMSFHGGLIGVIFASFLFAKKNNQNIFIYLDIVSIVAPIGIFLGRIANFINSELIGVPTNLPWSVVFLKIDDVPRHPSQIYEALLEGLLLFLLMNLIFKYKKIRGYVSSFFLILYSLFRIAAEQFRLPDEQIGYIFNMISMGTLLSLIMLITGVFLLKYEKLTCFQNFSRP